MSTKLGDLGWPWTA